jgi:hypothetical protein
MGTPVPPGGAAEQREINVDGRDEDGDG